MDAKVVMDEDAMSGGSYHLDCKRWMDGSRVAGVYVSECAVRVAVDITRFAANTIHPAFVSFDLFKSLQQSSSPSTLLNISNISGRKQIAIVDDLRAVFCIPLTVLSSNPLTHPFRERLRAVCLT